MNETIHTVLSFPGMEERSHTLNSLHVGVLIHNASSEVLFSNKAACSILGLGINELVGRNSFQPEWDIIHTDGSPFPCSLFPVTRVITTNKAVSNVVMGIYRRQTKDRVWILVNAEPLFDKAGSLKEVICSFSNITEHKLAEEKLTALYQRLESRAFELATSTADLQRFVYVATHDLQEPLRLVTSFTQLLKKKYAHQLDEQALEYINYAVEGASRMKKLILDLLEFSKFSSNQEEFTATNMTAVINDIRSVFSTEIESTKAELIVSALPTIKAKTSLIVQLFEQLISNALKYRNGSNPLIRINCEEDSEKFIFSVNDNGIGIDPRYAEKIFILFQRLHTANEVSESTGVGLAICKRIIELHRGTIWVDSEKGKGSTFFFTIPKEQNLLS